MRGDLEVGPAKALAAVHIAHATNCTAELHMVNGDKNQQGSSKNQRYANKLVNWSDMKQVMAAADCQNVRPVSF